MNNVHLIGLAAMLSFSVACAAQPDETSGGSSEQAVSGDEWTPAPNPNPGPDPEPSPEPLPAPGPLCKTLSGPGGAGPGIGLANPASVYCAELGFAAEGETCTFPDGTACEQWSFFRGECGQAHSFCNRQGGQVSAESEDMGGFTSTYALCTLPSGATCKEQDFAASCACE